MELKHCLRLNNPRSVTEQLDRKKRYRYKWRNSGEVKEFDTLPMSCEVFGFHHGQRVVAQKGRWKGTEATIIGVLDGWLWRHQDGEQGATAFHAKSQKDLTARYGLVGIGKIEAGEAVPLSLVNKMSINHCVENLDLKTPTTCPILLNQQNLSLVYSLTSDVWTSSSATDTFQDLLNLVPTPSSRGEDVDPVVLLGTITSALEGSQPAEGSNPLVRLTVYLLLQSPSLLLKTLLFTKNTAPDRMPADSYHEMTLRLVALESVPLWENISQDVLDIMKPFYKILTLYKCCSSELPAPPSGKVLVAGFDAPQDEVEKFARLTLGIRVTFPKILCCRHEGANRPARHPVVLVLKGKVWGFVASDYVPLPGVVLVQPFSSWCVVSIERRDHAVRVCLAWRDGGGAFEAPEDSVKSDFKSAVQRLVHAGRDSAKPRPSILDRPLQSVIEKLRPASAAPVEFNTVEKNISVPLLYYMPGNGVLTFDVSDAACSPFGLKPGQRCLIRSTNHRGIVTTIVGTLGGLLWHHEDGGTLRSFNYTTWSAIIKYYQLELIGWDPPFEYPARLIHNGTDYNTNERFMEVYEKHAYQVILHRAGDLANMRSCILGCKGENLYHLVLNTGEVQQYPLTDSGFYQFTLNYKYKYTDLPKTVTVNEQSVTTYEVRVSSTMEHSLVHGMVVKIVKGENVGSFAVVLGMRDGRVCTARVPFQKHFDILHLVEGTYVVVATPHEPMLDPHSLLANHPRRTASIAIIAANAPGLTKAATYTPYTQLAYFGEYITLDAGYGSCNIFRQYHMQRVKWHPAGCPTKVTTSTVVGTWMGELWRVDEGHVACKPWAGSSAEELAGRYTIWTDGLGQLPSVTNPFGAVAVNSWRHHEYTLPYIACKRSSEDGIMLGFDTRQEEIDKIAEGLNHGMRLQELERVATPQMTTVPENGELKRYWSWHKPSSRYTILGVYNDMLWALGQEGHAVEMPLSKLRCCKAIDEADENRLEDVPPRDDTPAPMRSKIDDKILRPFLTRVPLTPTKEMYNRLLGISREHFGDYLFWLLSLYAAQVPVDTRSDMLVKRLVVLETTCGLVVEIPTLQTFLKIQVNKTKGLEAEWRSQCVYNEIDARRMLQQCELRERRDVASALLMKKSSPALSTWFTSHATRQKSLAKRKSLLCTLAGIGKAHKWVKQARGKSVELSPPSFALEKQPTTPLRYTLHTSDTILLDVSDEACVDTFGFRSGDILEYANGDCKGRRCEIVGVHGGRLYRYEQQGRKGLFAFRGKSHSQITTLHSFTLISHGNELPTHDPFEFVDCTGTAHFFDISARACAAYDTLHGNRYLCTTGRYKGQVITVIGIRQENLWVAVDWSGAFRIVSLETNEAMFLFHGKVMPWTPAAPALRIGDKCFDCSAESHQRYGMKPGQKFQIPSCRDSSVVVGVRGGRLWYAMSSDKYPIPFETQNPVADLHLEQFGVPKVYSGGSIRSQMNEHNGGITKTFKFLGVGLAVCFFDTSDNAVGIFGLRHGKRIMLTPLQQPAETILATVVGVKDGLLWGQCDGNTYATSFNAKNEAGLQALWKVQSFTAVPVAEFTG